VRSRFDQLLLDNARRLGVIVHEQSQAKEMLVEGDRVVGLRWVDAAGAEQVTRASYILDATGHQGTFHRVVGERVFSKFFQNLALFGYFKNGRRMPKPNDGNILCAAFEHGWFWYIPLSPEITSVGAVVEKAYGKQLSEQGLEASMSSLIAACPLISEYLKDATRITEGDLGQLRVRKDYSYCSDRFWRKGMALIGDAACFVDPVFSSGVHLATYSALMAGRAVNSSLRSPADEALWFDTFETRYRKEYQAFYDFLFSFYEMGGSESSYFWRAREVLKTDEAANEAFVRLVAGAGTGVDDFLQIRAGLGTYMQLMVDVHGEHDATATERQANANQLQQHFGVSSVAARQVMTSAGFSRWSAGASEVAHLDLEAVGEVHPSSDGLFWERLAGERGGTPRNSPSQ
jgi:halogenation protein CepH